MDKQAWKKMVAKCARKREIVNAGAFLLVGVDREVIGMGDGCALVWVAEDGKWKMRFLNMENCDASNDGTVEIIADDSLYDDELDEDEFMEEQEEAADCRVDYCRNGASVCFHAHVNRTNDGLHIREDFVSMDRGDGPREIPIVYWNTGSNPVKADGTQISPAGNYVSMPDTPSRMKRKALKREQDEHLITWIKQQDQERKEAKLELLTAKAMELEPGWTEKQARRAAELFLEQEKDWVQSV